MAKADEDAAAEGRKNTERVVLVRVEIPANAIAEKHADLAVDGKIVAWVPVVDKKGVTRVFRGSKKNVVDEFAVRDEGDRPGEYKAPNLTSWRGTRPVILPEKPKAEKLWDENAV